MNAHETNVLNAPKKDLWKNIKRHFSVYALLVIPVVYYAIMKYGPIVNGQIAFKNFEPVDGVWGSVWVGFKNFSTFIHSFYFGELMRNTILYSLAKLCVSVPLSIILSVALYECTHNALRRIVQTLAYLPHFLSWVIVTGLVANVLVGDKTGILNGILLKLRLVKEPVQWLAIQKYFWHIVGWTYVWKEVGWNTIVYLGAMTAIDPCLYEAAQIDGCGRLRKIWHITLPGIKPTIIIMMIMSAGHILDANFEMPYLLQNGLIQDVAETIDIYVLKFGFNLQRYGLATAAGIFKNAVNILLLLIANWIAKKSGEERLV